VLFTLYNQEALMIHLPIWLDVAYTVFRAEQAAGWARRDRIERRWPVDPPEPWPVFLRRCGISYRRRLAEARRSRP